MKKLLTTSLLGAALIAGVAQAQDTEQLRIGVDVPYEPMEYRTPDGELTGFDIELGNALCAQIKAECEWVVQAWDGIIPGLLARKYDAIMSSMTINAGEVSRPSTMRLTAIEACGTAVEAR